MQELREQNKAILFTKKLIREVPVGFQSMECQINIKGKKGTDPKHIQKLLKTIEYSCIVMQALKYGVPVEVDIELE